MKLLLLMLAGLCSCQVTTQPKDLGALDWIPEQASRLEPNSNVLQLESLHFTSTPTAEHLQSLQQLKHLRSLEIWDEGCFRAPTYEVGRLDDATLKEISKLDRLETLAIAGWASAYSDRGLKPVINMPHLKRLKLNMAPLITDRAMLEIAKMRSLTHLDITYTTITDVGLSHLMAAPQLQSVAYGWTQTQTNHAHRFLETHPDSTFLIGFESP